MLRQLSIENYVLIDQLNLEFSDGLTVITGETGSGKSILLGALGLILGERADTSTVRKGAKKCIVEGWFDLSDQQLEDYFQENDLDFEEVSSFRREILSSGKTRAFVNDTPVKLSVLKNIGHRLVDVHSQHETLELNESQAQLKMLDRLASNEKLRQKYELLFEQYKVLEADLEDMREKERQSIADRDYIEFQLEELDNAKLDDIEEEQLEEELNTLENSEEIANALQSALSSLSEGNVNALEELRNARHDIGKIAGYGKNYSEWLERLESQYLELKDIADSIEMAAQDSVPDPGRLEILTARYDEINRLKMKHRAEKVSELISARDELRKRLDDISTLSGRIGEQEEAIKQKRHELEKAGEELHKSRTSVAPKLQKEVSNLLEQLAMPSADLKVDIQRIEPTSTGITEVEFLFRTNKGGDYNPLRKAASGGELSRLMLTVKAVTARGSGWPTLIFDEIDTGVSGEVARKMGRILRDMAGSRQLLCITHLAQIAARGDDHLKVLKEEGRSTTRTAVERLDQNMRIDELAQMLSGARASEAAVANARELLKNA